MTGSFFSDLVNGEGGSIEDQGKEIHSDGLSVYFGIYGVMVGDRRAVANKTFGAATTDELLLSLYIIGVVSFLFLRPPTTFDPSTIETLTHPPSAIRLEFIMRHLKRWCEESRRNLLAFLNATTLSNESTCPHCLRVQERSMGRNKSRSLNSLTMSNELF